MLVGLIADTHGVFDPDAALLLRGVDLLLHAGDVGHHGGHAEVLRAYAKATCAPVLAVSGNVDDKPGASELLPQHRVVQVVGWTLLLIHVVTPSPAAPVDATAALLIKQHAPDVVVFGHSHKAALWRSSGGVHFINPGSAGPARFKLQRTVATLQLQPKHSSEDCLDVIAACGMSWQEACRVPKRPAALAASPAAHAATAMAFPQQSAAASSVQRSARVQVTAHDSAWQQEGCASCSSHTTGQVTPAGTKGRRSSRLQHCPNLRMSTRDVQRCRTSGLCVTGPRDQSDGNASVLPCDVPPPATGPKGQPPVGAAAGASRRAAACVCAVDPGHQAQAGGQTQHGRSQAGVLRVYELLQKAPPRLKVCAHG